MPIDTDIVERLRVSRYEQRLCCEAADEIERLRAKLKPYEDNDEFWREAKSHCQQGATK